MIKFFLGLLVGIGLLLLTGYLFATRGGIPFATKGGPLPMERSIAHQALVTSIGESSGDQPPIPADEANLLAGARVYQQNACMMCHGKLDQSASDFAKRFYPHAPQLLPPSEGVTDDPVGTTHWVVKNGIRFSAMPSFEGRLSDTEIWQVSLLLRNANKLPPSVQEILRPAN
jgi:mono/diheme cytochrome c family protein